MLGEADLYACTHACRTTMPGAEQRWRCISWLLRHQVLLVAGCDLQAGAQISNQHQMCLLLLHGCRIRMVRQTWMLGEINLYARANAGRISIPGAGHRTWRRISWLRCFQRPLVAGCDLRAGAQISNQHLGCPPFLDGFRTCMVRQAKTLEETNLYVKADAGKITTSGVGPQTRRHFSLQIQRMILP
jgi:hypothetical protein